MKRKLWLMAAALALVMTVAALPAMGDMPSGDTGEVISMNATLREGNSTSSTTIQSLHNGDTFDILDRDGDWLYIAYYDATQAQTINGWLLNYYVVENPIHITLRNSNTPAYAYPSSASKRVGSLVKYTRLTVIAELDRYWVVSLREAAACIPKTAKVWLDDDLAYWNSVSPTAGTVIKRTTIRTGPGTGWYAVETLAVGSTVQILGADGDWYVIRYKEGVAYIKMADVSM